MSDVTSRARRRRTVLLVLLVCSLGGGGLAVARLYAPAQVSAGQPTVPADASTHEARPDSPPPTREVIAPAQPRGGPPTTTREPPTLTWSYDILPVTPTAGFGVESLYILHAVGAMPQTPVAPANLRPPNDQLRALTDLNRFGELRGPGHFMHLGSDYATLNNAAMVSPTDDAVLVAAAHVEPYTYVGVAIDMSGSIQMYAVTVETEQGAVSYLICYAHLSPGSNEEAMAQATANAGRVETVGMVAALEPDGGPLSDFHIAVIDVARLYQKTGEDELEGALTALFTREMPRDNQKYTDLFVRPEDIMTALESLLPDA